MNSIVTLYETFDRVVVVNLARRHERFVQFTRQLDHWPFRPPQRFEAIDGLQVPVPDRWPHGPGAWGCMLSHRAVLASAIADQMSSLFVLEDDARAVPGFAELAGNFLANVPDDWDCLMFGAEHMLPPLAVRPGVVQCMASNRTHAFAVRGRMMPILLEFWKHFDSDHCDIVLASLMPRFKVYAPDPLLIGQDAGPSDVTGRQERLRFISTTQSNSAAMADSPDSIEHGQMADPELART
jgi:hypothetical protein